MSKSKKDRPRPDSTEPKQSRTTASPSRREQLRAERAAEAKRARARRIVTVAAGVVALVIVVTVAVVLVQQVRQPKKVYTPNPEATQITPPNATADGSAIAYAAQTPAPADAPQVVAYLDYQCPGCALASSRIDPKLEALADAGEISLAYHILHGLDGGFPGQHSYRATAAASCSDQFGVFAEYSKIIFANQPAREGDGWTDEQLIEWAQQAGIEGTDLEAFTTCYNDLATNDFVLGMQNSRPAFVEGTPSFAVNGKLVYFSENDLASEQAMLARIQAAAA